MSEAATLVPVSELIPFLTAISERDWKRFGEVEKQFVENHGVEEWEEFFAYRLKPSLDKDSDRWLLVQWCSTGIVPYIVNKIWFFSCDRILKQPIYVAGFSTSQNRVAPLGKSPGKARHRHPSLKWR
jgi:hypothetical protein